MKRILFLLSFFICLNAHAGDIYESPQWLALVHYQPRALGGYKSTIDSTGFFLSKSGKYDPKAELDATIKMFDGDEVEKQCLFPARYKFLKAQGLVNKPMPECAEYQQFYKDLSPAGVTLLFTDAYMNNPSSLFGHTLFRIDTSRKGTQLLAHGVNYGAFTGDDGGALFAIKGLAGGYFGGFTVKRYYDVINMYNNIENRDIWELNLNFDEDELDTFVAHLWEAGHAQARYFFFTRNCSYLLMEMLDAVRPSLKLAEEFPVQAIPLDTFKAVNSREGLVKGLNYRPSRQSKIVYQYNQLNSKAKSVLGGFLKKGELEENNLSDEQKANLIDTAYQYVQYLNVERKIERDDYRKKSFALLMERNKIKQDVKLNPLTKGRSPLDTHESKRATIGFGSRNGQAFQEFSIRPAYHSLTDNNYGYLKGAEINFLNLGFRHYDNDDKYVLQNLDLVGIKSLSPVNELFFPYSYDIQAGIKREYNGERDEEGYAFNLKFGGGLTYELAQSFWVYGMINNYASYGGFLPHNQWVGVGGSVGTYIDVGNLRILAEAEKVLATSHFADKMKYKIEAAYALSTNHTLAASYSYEHNYGKNLSEPMVSYRLNF